MSASTLLQYAIVGCGVIGRKRAAGLRAGQLRYACDLNADRAGALAATAPGCQATTDLQTALADPAVNVVVVATLNASLAPITCAALEAGKHVLVEKPGALSSAQLRTVEAIRQRTKRRVQIGYNHRHHPALQKARTLVDSGELGPLMFLRGRYGHGGRKGYNREWRADPALSGGGELIDQGVHLIDLAGWFLGEFPTVEGHVATFYWDMKVDDNAFVSLRTAAGQTAWLHVSCTEWKNLFSFEIYGRDGKIAIDGLGGSYGPERCTWYRMLPQMGPPETTTWDYLQSDGSWSAELDAFEREIFEDHPDLGLACHIRTLEIVETIYSKPRCPVSSAGLPPAHSP